MPDVTDYAILRSDVGMTIVTLTDIQAAAIYTQVAVLYPTGTAAVVYAAARVQVLRQLLSSFATQVSYTQNQESVNQSDAFKNLEKLLNYWERKLAEAIEADAEVVTGVQPPASGSVRLRAVW